MHLLEIRQSLEDTTIEQDIYASSKILKKLSKVVDNSADLSIDDFTYISALLSKSKILLEKTYTIFKLNTEEVQKNDKQKTN